MQRRLVPGLAIVGVIVGVVVACTTTVDGTGTGTGTPFVEAGVSEPEDANNKADARNFCIATGTACSSNDQCCSKECVDRNCTCSSQGMPCRETPDRPDNCCSVCGPDNVCKCGPPGVKCSKDSDCCEGRCRGGHCDRLKVGEKCASPGQCVSETCGATGTCECKKVTVDGGPACCAQYDEPCGPTTTCCATGSSCVNSKCSCVTTGTCNVDEDCCEGGCENKQCCVGLGHACDNTRPCCGTNNFCDPSTSKCAVKVPTCKAEDAKCGSNAECCSRSCTYSFTRFANTCD